MLFAFPTSRSFFSFPFTAVGADLPLPLLPFPFSGSKGDCFPLPLPFIPKGDHFPLPLPFINFPLPLPPFQWGSHLASSTLAPQCTNVHGCRSSSMHSPEVCNMARLAVFSSRISHSVIPIHCPVLTFSLTCCCKGPVVLFNSVATRMLSGSAAPVCLSYLAFSVSHSL